MEGDDLTRASMAECEAVAMRRSDVRSRLAALSRIA
jgi:hypothetical protein